MFAVSGSTTCYRCNLRPVTSINSFSAQMEVTHLIFYFYAQLIKIEDLCEYSPLVLANIRRL